MGITALLCTDGSELANRAAAKGLAILGPVDQAIVVTVIEPVDLALGAQVSGFAGSAMSPEEYERGRTAMVESGEAALEGAVTELGLSGARTQLLEGDAGAVLCDFAQQVDADVIVMGTRGRGGFKRALLGSVSDHVVRNAPCPVIITNPEGD